jgi:hypothetical protein
MIFIRPARFSTESLSAGPSLRLMFFAQSVLNRLSLVRLACRYLQASHSPRQIEVG